MTASQLQLFDPWIVEERVSARARRIRVDVRPDGAVVLTIPPRASRLNARRFLEDSREWIERTRARLLARPRPTARPMRWDGSDRLLLHGVEVSVTVERARSARVHVTLAPSGIHVQAPVAASADLLRRRLLAALTEHARARGRCLLDEESARLGLRYSSLTVRDARSRWGSCAPDGRIMLATRLAMAPLEVFRYVAVHELCHLRWRGHGARFWGLVERQLPDFESSRAWLRRHGDEIQAVLRERSDFRR